MVGAGVVTAGLVLLFVVAALIVALEDATFAHRKAVRRQAALRQMGEHLRR